MAGAFAIRRVPGRTLPKPRPIELKDYDVPAQCVACGRPESITLGLDQAELPPPHVCHPCEEGAADQISPLSS